MPNVFKHVFKLASLNGLDVATNANGDYSSEAASYRLAPPDSQVYVVSRMIVTIIDLTVDNFADYGAIASGVTNGIRIYHRDSGGVSIEEITAFPIKTNGDWATHCFDVDLKTLGAGNDYVVVRWTFAQSGKEVVVNGKEGEYLDIALSDSFTGLVGHYFQFQGYIQSPDRWG